MVNFTFSNPTFLWLLILAPVFIFVYIIALSSNKRKGMVFSNFKAIERFYGVQFFSKNFLYLYFNLFVLMVIVFGLAGLSVSFKTNTSPNSFVVAIDSSSSMFTTDINPNRFIAAKDAAKEFIHNLSIGTEVGIVGFSGVATVYKDSTNDKMLMEMGINNIVPGDVEGTNIYDALLATDRIFDFSGTTKKRTLILISDGQLNVGDAALIIDYAKRNDIVIYTIGVGTESGGESVFNMISKTDIDFLKSLSFNTGGRFFRVDAGENFSDFLNEFSGTGIYDITIDLSSYLIMFSILLFLINWILYNFRFKIFP